MIAAHSVEPLMCYTTQEAEMKRAREETRKAEEAEAAKWMKLMKVEQQGTGA